MDKQNDEVICGRKKNECSAEEYIQVLKENYWLQYRFGYMNREVSIRSSNELVHNSETNEIHFKQFITLKDIKEFINKKFFGLLPILHSMKFNQDDFGVFSIHYNQRIKGLEIKSFDVKYI